MEFIVTHWDLIKEKEKLTQIFTQLDTNGDQTLTKAELKRGLETGGVLISEDDFEEFFSKLDVNNNGTISYTYITLFFHFVVLK